MTVSILFESRPFIGQWRTSPMDKPLNDVSILFESRPFIGPAEDKQYITEVIEKFQSSLSRGHSSDSSGCARSSGGRVGIVSILFESRPFIGLLLCSVANAQSATVSILFESRPFIAPGIHLVPNQTQHWH